MNERWMWAIRYAAVIAVALVLGAALGEMELFRTTRLGSSGLDAARLVRFLSYGGALFLFWLLAQRVALLLDGTSAAWRWAKAGLVPLTTLVVVACGQAVALLVLGPFLSRGWHQAYNWVFILAITVSAAWLVAALFTGSQRLIREE